MKNARSNSLNDKSETKTKTKREIYGRRNSTAELFDCMETYLVRHGLKPSFGCVKDASQESVDDFRRPNCIVAIDVRKEGRLVDEECKAFHTLISKREIRKKAINVSTYAAIYCLGGYLFNPKTKERTAPANDWMYKSNKGELKRILPVPDGRINFGCAANLGVIYIIGGQTFNNVPLQTCKKYDIYENQWKDLPDLEFSLSWSGVTVDERGRVYVIGGYNVIGGEVIMSNRTYRYDPGRCKWERFPEYPVECCNMMLLIKNTTVYGCGGRSFDDDGLIQMHTYIYKLDEGATEWKLVTEIPEYNRKGMGMMYEQGHVSVMKKKVNAVTHEVLKIEIIRNYNIETNTWALGPLKFEDLEANGLEPKQ